MLIINISVASCYIFLALYLVLRRPTLIIFAPWIFGWAISFPSLIMIEEGAFIAEQSAVGFRNGSTLLFSLFAYSSLFVFYKLSNRVVIYPKKKAVVWLFSLSTLPFIGAIFYAISFNADFTRFNIFSIHPVFERFLNYYNFAYYALYLYCVLKEAEQRRRIYYFLVALVVTYLTGSEFGGFVSTFFVFATGELVSSKTPVSIKYKFYNIGIFCVVAFAALAYKAFRMPDDSFEVLNRVILQSHLFWGSVNMETPIGLINFTQNFINHITSFPENRPTTQYGLGALMYEMSGPLADTFLEDGVRFSGGYPAILIYYFGILAALAINLIITGLIATYFHYLLVIANKHNVIIFILYLKLASMLLVDFYSAGELWNLNGKSIVLAVAFVAILFALRTLRSSRSSST
ncbi:MAG: hypothetical protein IPO13_08715 [Rhodocyclaceae bacterium]|nr:hypothetical protein [Rhodocyclaceae bacterium]